MSENKIQNKELQETPADEKSTGELSTDQLDQVSGGSSGAAGTAPTPHH
jgi:hypothetical protein